MEAGVEVAGWILPSLAVPALEGRKRLRVLGFNIGNSCSGSQHFSSLERLGVPELLAGGLAILNALG